MVALLGYATAVVALAVLLVSLTWLARRVRRHGTGGGIMGPIDEIYRPSAHRLRFEIEAHEQRMLPLPAPQDKHPRDAG